MLRQVSNDVRVQAPMAQASMPRASGQEAAPRVDRSDIPPNWESSVDWEQAVQEALAALQKEFKNVRIVVGDVANNAELRALAAQAGRGAYLVVSNEFLKQMASGAPAYCAGRELLRELAAQMEPYAGGPIGMGAYLNEDGVTYWSTVPAGKPPEYSWNSTQNQKPKTLADWMKEAQEKARAGAEKRSAATRARLLRSINMSATRAYMRLARARTKSEVKAVAYSTGNAIYRLKLAMSQSSGPDKEKLRAVLAQMTTAQMRARRKVVQLDEESELRRRQEQAQTKQRQLQLKAELEQRRASRRAKEHAMVQNSAMNDYFLAEQARKEQLSALQADMLSSLQSVAAASAMEGMGGGAGVAQGGGAELAAQVFVSETVPVAIA